ncbi:ImmA/IrrE family metallo-endopeptidase [Rhizorhabdus sp.]|uniref:ImmA/IrrE family metallo-endopeptidase n=1 Tax=Rhizorhabdus sp. TaxID=1968843 RepID=UPI0025CEB615|nr:ImmA/IrrE family metallo-endopeptidase [Rhizorhabdus sp.]
MDIALTSGDPASALWHRVDKSDLQKIWDLFDNHPVPVGQVADRLGIDVLSLTLPTEISGLIRRNENGKFEIHINNTDAPVRQRFTVCHEIAHYLLHRNLIDGDGITDNILYRSKLSNKQEAEANRLGSAILLPWKNIITWHSEKYGTYPSKENIEEIAQQFRASSLAVGFRLGI